MKLGDMSNRALILFNIGETRRNTKLLDNHIAHHEEQDDRRFKIHVGLLLVFLATVGLLVVAVVT